MKKSLNLQESGVICEKENEIEISQNIETENKLVTKKPWFPKSSILKTQEENLKSVSSTEASESFCLSDVFIKKM